MRIALAQTGLEPATTDEALAELTRLAGAARDGGARLIVFPELFMCGYGDTERVRGLALSSAALEALLEPVARRIGVALCVGYAERAQDGIYNAALLVDASGRQCLNYRKMHLWETFETDTFRPGGLPAIAELDGIRIGILICFDLDFPVAMQDLARRGADLVLVPSATTMPYRIVPEAQVPVRAYENALFVAFCNRAASECEPGYAGASTVAAPDGSVLARAALSRPDLVFADIDLAAAAGYRQAHRYVEQQRSDIFPLRDLSARGGAR